MTPNHRILIIDDDFDVWKAYRLVLAPDKEIGQPLGAQLAKLLGSDTHSSFSKSIPDFDIHYANQGQTGFKMVEESLSSGNPFAVAFVDIRMPPGWDGLDTAARIRGIDPDIEIVIVTAYSDRNREEIARRVPPPSKLLFFRKPFDPDELLQLAISLTEKWNLGCKERAAREGLAESRARFKALVESTSDWLWETGTDGCFTYVSPISEMIYGYRPEELISGHYSLLLPESERPLFEDFLKNCLKGMRGFHGIGRACRKKDGSEVYIESSAVPIISQEGNITGFRGIDRDVTEKKKEQEKRARLEEQYRQSQKMEGLGTLAGGIAHDLNNLLTPILGFSEISLIKCGADSPVRDHLKIIIQCANRAAELIRRILAFSRKQVMVAAPINLNNVINDLTKMLCRLIREDVELRFELAENIWSINADASQIEQVLINLIVNARDAVRENGIISIFTKNREISAEDKLFDIGNKPILGCFVELSVSDNGIGMSPETVQRIFDPFFTTKELGQGTGLGLATVYGIMTQHDAPIRIDTALDKGAKFSLFFPKLQGETQSLQTAANNRDIRGGTETILVAEDNSYVMTMISKTLQYFGYKVLTAKNGSEAALLAANCKYGFDLLVTDLIMPGLNGQALAEMFRMEKNGLPVLFISGYPQDVIPGTLLNETVTEFLRKPFSPQDLARKVRILLDR